MASAPAHGRSPPLRVVAWAAASAVLLHWVVLGAWPMPGASRSPVRTDAAGRVQARLLPVQPAEAGSRPATAGPDPVPPTVPVEAVALAPSGDKARRQRVVVPPTPPPPTVSAPALPVAVPRELPGTPPDDAAAGLEAALTAGQPLDAALELAAPAAGPAGSAGAALADDPDGASPPPVYATRIPPPVQLVFRLQRGLLRGEAALSWQPAASGSGGGSYQLGLEARAAGLPILSQTSQGGFDAAGLAPLRFTDRRLRGSTRATNFQRDRGMVGFSGPGVEYPLFAGAQDRLSWMLQLPAIVAALPPARRASTEVSLQVFGARGDVAGWQFREVGGDRVATDGGTVPALKWVRTPRKPNDTQVEIWLDPARHHLPIKVRIGNPPDGETLELLRLGG